MTCHVESVWVAKGYAPVSLAQRLHHIRNTADDIHTLAAQLILEIRHLHVQHTSQSTNHTMQRQPHMKCYGCILHTISSFAFMLSSSSLMFPYVLWYSSRRRSRIFAGPPPLLSCFIAKANPSAIPDRRTSSMRSGGVAPDRV